MYFVSVLFFTHILSYWTSVIFYTYLYNQWKDKSLYVIKKVLINQFIFTPIFIIPYYFYPKSYSTINIFWQLPLIVILTDIIFYISHRYFHYNKFLYNNIHINHHEFDPPIASAALYAHPIEHIFINLLSTVLPMFIVKSNLFVSVIWTIIASVNVVIAHSGTWKNDPHTTHHKYLICNYGAGLLLMDKIFNTYKSEKNKN